MKHENTFVALKVQKSAPSYKVAAYDEVEILDVIAKNIYNVDWLNDLKKYHPGMSDEELARSTVNSRASTRKLYSCLTLSCIMARMEITSSWSLRFSESIYLRL